MNNCKKCGAIIGADYIFCGKCGEPVSRGVSEEKPVKVKKLKRIYFLEKKLSRSPVFNGIFCGVWAILSGMWLMLIAEALRNIRIDTTGIGILWSQFLYKYEYVKEGLSLSYVSKEFNSLVNYAVLWAFFVFSAVIAVVSVILFVVFLIRFIFIKKGRAYGKTLEKIKRITAKTGLISIAVFVVVIIISYILKGIV